MAESCREGCSSFIPTELVNSSSTCSSITGDTNYICFDGAHHLGKVNTQLLACTAALSSERGDMRGVAT